MYLWPAVASVLQAQRYTQLSNHLLTFVPTVGVSEPGSPYLYVCGPGAPQMEKAMVPQYRHNGGSIGVVSLLLWHFKSRSGN